MKTSILITALLSISLLAGCIQSDEKVPVKFFTVVATGDTVHPVNDGHLDEFIELGRDIYLPTSGIIRSADLAFANLEGPFIHDNPERAAGSIVFANYPGDIDNLIWAGFNCFSLANNHSFDCGGDGVNSTLNLFENKRIEYGSRKLVWAGLGRTGESAEKHPAVIINGVKVAFMAYSARHNKWNDSVNVYSPDKVLADIESVKDAGLVILSIHHGDEFIHAPSAGIVREYRSFIDAGADIILGHHSHVAQGMEKYGNGMIFYSLGNYAMGTVSRRHLAHNGKLYSFIARISYRIGDKGPAPMCVELFPLYVDNVIQLTVNGKTLTRRRFVPEVLTGDFADHVLDSLEIWSAMIPDNRTQFTRRGDAAVIQFNQQQ